MGNVNLHYQDGEDRADEKFDIKREGISIEDLKKLEEQKKEKSNTEVEKLEEIVKARKNESSKE